MWVGTAFWGALDTAFCRIYELPCRTWVRQKLFGLAMLGLVLLFFAATVAMPAVQSLLLANKEDLPFGLSDRDALYTITLAAGFVIIFGALCTIYRTVPNTAVAWHGVWPGALGATLAIGIVDYGFPFYLSNVSVLAGLRTTIVFVLIVLIWFYLLAIIILAGGVVNELRLERQRAGTLANVPDPKTEELRLEQVEKERRGARSRRPGGRGAGDRDARAPRRPRGLSAGEAGRARRGGGRRGQRGVAMEGHEERAAEAEFELAEMEEQSDDLAEDIEQAKDDWEQKKQAGSVPGAGTGDEADDPTPTPRARARPRSRTSRRTSGRARGPSRGPRPRSPSRSAPYRGDDAPAARRRHRPARRARRRRSRSPC